MALHKKYRNQVTRQLTPANFSAGVDVVVVGTAAASAMFPFVTVQGIYETIDGRTCHEIVFCGL